MMQTSSAIYAHAACVCVCACVCVRACARTCARACSGEGRKKRARRRGLELCTGGLLLLLHRRRGCVSPLMSLAGQGAHSPLRVNAAGLCVAAHVSRRSRRSLTTASECGGAVCRRSCLSPVKALTHRNNDICLERQNDEDNWN